MPFILPPLPTLTTCTDFSATFKRVRTPSVKLLGSIVSSDPVFIQSKIDKKLSTLQIKLDRCANLSECKVAFDRFVEHAFYCRFGGDINNRNNAIRDEIHVHGHGGGVVVAKDPLDILGETDARKPADILVKNFMNSMAACLDVTVTNNATFK